MVAVIRSRSALVPRIGLTLGSGLGGVMDAAARGATVVDFAYNIHTDVGNKCVAARINSEIQPLRTELRNGDMVEIITSPQAQPHEDWLKIVRTTGARSKIRHWLRQQRHADSVTLGREMLERETTKQGLEWREISRPEMLAKAAAAAGSAPT